MHSTSLTQRTTDLLKSLVGPLYLAVAVSVPISVRIYFSAIDLEVIFPAEPLIGILGIIVLLLLVLHGWRAWDRKALRHPLFITVVLWMVILGLSALGSEWPLASVKALVVRSAFIVVFFIAPLAIPSVLNIDRYRLLFAHAMALVLVMVWSMANGADVGFGREGAALAPFPFYVDHTSYAAAVSFAVFTFISEAFASRRPGRRWPPMDLFLLAFLATAAFYFAYCRAAWIGLLATLPVLVFLARRVRVRAVLITAASAFVAAVLVATLVASGRGPALADSNSSGAGLRESVLSLSNVKNDTSNMERVNRWKSAFRMFLDEPVLGHGVGTFQFAFMPYQLKEEMTYISVTGPVDPQRVQRVWSYSDAMFIRNNPQNLYCSGGTAHSELMLALSESGFIAPLIFLLMMFLALWTGYTNVQGMAGGADRMRYLCVWLATLAYFVHGFFNNFLDDPKVAFVFWIAMGLLIGKPGINASERLGDPASRGATHGTHGHGSATR